MRLRHVLLFLAGLYFVFALLRRFPFLFLLLILAASLWFLKAMQMVPPSWRRSVEALFETLFASGVVEKKRQEFLVCAFSMLAKLARSDGRISPAEIEVVERYIRDELELNESQRQKVIDIFRQAKDSPLQFTDYASRFYHAFSAQPSMLGHMIDILLQVAAADGSIAEEEDRLIRGAALRFGLRESRYESLRAQYVNGARRRTASDRAKTAEREAETRRPVNGLAQAYGVLQCSADASDGEIKKAYRRLALEHHPDRVMARGLPPELTKTASRKFREIQEAYELVRDVRGLK